MEEAKKIDFAVGGQAVVEGVMMRSPEHITVAVRKLDGSIRFQEKKFISAVRRWKIEKIPLVRGIVNMFEMIVVGTRALNFAANEQIEDEENRIEEGKKSKTLKKLTRPSRLVRVGEEKEQKTLLARFAGAALFAGSIIFALGLSIFLFKFLPFWIASFLSDVSPTIANNYFLFNLIDGVLKTSFFILYIWLIGLLPGLRRVFEYHGAEHKAVFTYEGGLPLTVANAKTQSRFHPRCGTSFILIVFVISILAYTLVPRGADFWLTFMQRISFLPLIAGLSYEFLKFSAKRKDSALLKLTTRPGLYLQRLTTREPDETQLEVALVALDKALKLEKTAR